MDTTTVHRILTTTTTTEVVVEVAIVATEEATTIAKEAKTTTVEDMIATKEAAAIKTATWVEGTTVVDHQTEMAIIVKGMEEDITVKEVVTTEEVAVGTTPATVVLMDGVQEPVSSSGHLATKVVIKGDDG